jgi:anti-sigma regulatory factor (Ser/Thr protein kinase)
MRTPSPEGLGHGASASSLRLELQREVRAPAIARAAVSERATELGIDASIEQTLVLLVSEVVSNAVRHSPGPADAPIELLATMSKQKIRVAVTDAGEGFTPRPREPDSLSDGYGLYLLDRAASSWGVESQRGTTVWFELRRGQAADAATSSG